MWTRPDGVSVGGAMALTDEMKGHGVPPHWMVYVGTADIEATSAHVERLGGGALMPIEDVPAVGRVRAMRDPQGAAFGLYQPLNPQRPEAVAQLGDLSWIELMTTDPPAALTFYQTLFGWQPIQTVDMGPMGIYQTFGRHLGPIGGMMRKPPHMAQVPSHWGVYFRVPDVAAAASRVTAAGGQILNGPMEVPDGSRIVTCMDPQGVVFSLHALAG
jgi:predicted enzyme related to lactoylglutathione lyase